MALPAELRERSAIASPAFEAGCSERQIEALPVCSKQMEVRRDLMGIEELLHCKFEGVLS